MYVIDASVHVADARPQEPHHEQARELLSRLTAKDRVVYLPVNVLAEIAAAISRGTSQPVLAQRWVSAIRNIPNFEFVPVSDELGLLAAELAAQQQIHGCDAVYVALARERGAVLITLDRQQRDRVPPDVVARTPAQELAELGW